MTTTASAERPARRSAADVDAIAAAYRSGQVFLGEMTMPMIDLRHYLEPERNMHHSLQSFSTRLRILRRQGHADAQLIWSAKPPYSPLSNAIELLVRWLENMRADSDLSVVAARPADATDRCYGAGGELIASGNDVWDGAWNGKSSGACMSVYPIYSNPRLIAGDDYAGDIFKCYLQPVDTAIANGVYAPIDVTTQRHELKRIFPTGVCDYSLGDAGRPADVPGGQ